jgi:putative endonuclease
MDPQRIAGWIFGSRPLRSAARGASPLSRLIAGLRAVAGLENPPRDRRAALGAMGERMAVRRLRREGYRIVARNFRAAGAEIDAVAIDRDTLVFVEVKTRLSAAAGPPEDSVHAVKQNHIRRAAAIYARAYRMEDRPMRFDVVAISRQDGGWRLEIIKDAF